MRSYLTSKPHLVTFGLMLAVAACMHFGIVEPSGAMLGFAALSTAPFSVNPELTAIAVGFKNTEDSLIADRVLPRVPTGETFEWTKYKTEQAYTVPDTKVGRKSEPNQVTFEGEAVQDKVEDHGLDDFIPQRDVDVFNNMPKPPSGRGPIHPEQLSTMMLSNLVLLSREIRVAGVVFNAANYETGLKETLSGTDQWSDYTNSNPIKDLLEALDACLIRPNKFVLGGAAWTVMRQHPKVLQAVHINPTGTGTVTREQVAKVLEIDEVIVGGSRVNTARKGQTASYQRTWGKHASLLYISEIAAQTFQPTWGWTADFGGKFAAVIPEPKKGLKGGNTIRVGEQVKELVAAPGAGYFFQNVVA